MISIRIVFCLILACSITNVCEGRFYLEERKLAKVEAAKFAKEICNLQGLKLIATGGRGAAELEGLSLEFQDEQKLTVAEVRRIYVSLMERLIKRINTVSVVRPFFKQYPLKSNNFDIGIMYVEYDKGKELFVSDPYVCTVRLINGKIYYNTSPEGKNLKRLYIESYEDALRIVNEESTFVKIN